MKKFIALTVALFTARIAQLANEVSDAIDEITLCNEFKLREDGWVEVAPYGDWTHSAGIQRFTKADAEQMANEFHSLGNIAVRILGLPWYIGHPDHPKFKDRYKDTRAYGRIKDLKAGDGALLANVKWSTAGRQLIEDEAFHGHSPNWKAKRDASGFFRPFSLTSVGFTNEANIPVTPVSLANEEENNMNRNELITRLGLEANATDEQILQAVQLANEARTNLVNLQTELANEQAAREAANSAKATAEAALANERRARATQVVAGLVKEGRVLPAEQEQTITDLANAVDFDAKEAELRSIAPKMKTSSSAGDLGKRAGDVQDRSSKVLSLVNERIEKHGEDYDTAFTAIQKEHPALFDAMKQPATATK